MAKKTEDEVRNEAGVIFGFIDSSGVNVENTDICNKVQFKSGKMKYIGGLSWLT